MVLRVPVHPGAVYLTCLNVSTQSYAQLCASPPGTFDTLGLAETGVFYPF